MRGLLGEIEQSTQAMSAIVTAVKSYAYLDRAPVQQVDVPASLESTLLMLRHKLEAGIEVVRDFAQDVPAVEAHGSELNQVWTNLIDNAIHAMAGRGTLELRVRRLGDSVVVSITDDGRGIPPDAQSRIFDPFWTTKQPGEGSGLGLHIARNIVQDVHGGRISFASAPGRTTFEVALPIRLQRARA
jgi:signal transduction histidine kinase